MRLSLPTWIVLGACLVLPRPALAWSRQGHRIVCRIAWQLLDQQHRAEVERLTSAYRNPDGEPVGSYFDACAFADEVRSRARNTPSWSRYAMLEPWHFANVPRTTTRLATPPCQVPCVITAVEAHADSLRRATSDASKAEALLFLSHWIGDIHQPLHVAFVDDRGGNGVRPIEGGFYSESNLHALWDVGLLAKLLGATPWQDFADQLAHAITPAQRATWIQGAAVDWAQESYDLVTSPAAQYCEWQVIGGARTCSARAGGRVLGESYQAEFADDVMLRLQQAGARLAEMLRLNLTIP
jgi:nuclease S1